MKRVLRALLLAIVVLGLGYFLLIDHVLKAAMESAGSKALLAEFNVGGVTFHLFPTSIRLESVQITNPQQPLHNLIEFEALTTPLSINAIIDRKIDIPELQIHGLRFDTTRAHSGAIAGLTPATTAAAATSELPDSAQVALQQQQRLQNEIDRTKKDLGAILAKWRERLQQLPDDDLIATYRQRAQGLRQAHQDAELMMFSQHLESQVDNARQLVTEFEADIQNARAQLAYAQAAPQSGANISATPQPMNNVVGALLGAEFKPLLTAITQQLNQLVVQQNVDQTPQFALLVRRIAVDGRLDIGEQPLLFTGTVDNFTPQPRLWDVATNFALAGVPEQSSQFKAHGQMDFRKTPRMDMRFDLRQFPLKDFPLSKNPQLGIVIEKALADMQGLLSSTGYQLDLNFLSRFQQATLNIQASTDNASQMLANALRGVDEFDMNLQITGGMQKPTLTFDSSLTPRLAAALSEQLQATDGAQPSGLSTEMQQQLSSVQQLASDFENLHRQLLAKQAALQSVFGS